MATGNPDEGAIRRGEPPYRPGPRPEPASTKKPAPARLFRYVVPLLAILLAAVAVAWWYFDLGHRPVEKMPWLHGKATEEVLAELGEPSSQFEYTMGKSPGGEFRVELFNTYPPNDPKTADVRIKEMQWHKMRYHVAVWMHQVNGEWIVLDTCRWQEGIAF
jgi:hypothetical protein